MRLSTALITTPLTAFAASAFYRHDRRGVAGAALFLLYRAAYTASDMLAVTCDPVMMLPLAWALVAIRDEDESAHPGRVFVFAGGLEGLVYWNVTHNFEYLQNPITAAAAGWRPDSPWPSSPGGPPPTWRARTDAPERR